jgi:hypothetical protein
MEYWMSSVLRQLGFHNRWSEKLLEYQLEYAIERKSVILYNRQPNLAREVNMKKLRFLIGLCTAILICACATQSGIVLNDEQLPSPVDLSQTFPQSESNLYWLTNDTYYDPAQLVGVVFGFGVKTDENYSGNPLADFTPEKLGRIVGWEKTEPAPARVRTSLALTEEAALSAAALTYLSANLKGGKIASVVVSDLKIIRAEDETTNYFQSLGQWLTSYSGLVNRYYSVMVVDGALLRSVTGRYYTEYTTDGQTGVFGINVEGSYYYSNEEYFVDYIFGLNFLNLTNLAASILTPPLESVMSSEFDPRHFRPDISELEDLDREQLQSFFFNP